MQKQPQAGHHYNNKCQKIKNNLTQNLILGMAPETYTIALSLKRLANGKIHGNRILLLVNMP